MNIIIIDPTNSIPGNYKDVLKHTTNCNKILYMSDVIEDIRRGYIIKVQEENTTPKTYLRYIKIHIVDKTQKTNIILYNVDIDDIHKYYYYMNYLDYNTVFIIDNPNINKDEPLFDQYDNIIIRHNIFENEEILNTLLSINPLQYNINKLTKSNFVIRDQVNNNYGKHRYGWNYVKDSINSIGKEGVLLDIFLEKTFLWDADLNTTYNEPWMGIFHNPVEMPAYFMKIFKIDDIFLNYSFIKSMDTTKGIITLSQYNKKFLEVIKQNPISLCFTSSQQLEYTLDPYNVFKNRR